MAASRRKTAIGMAGWMMRGWRFYFGTAPFGCFFRPGYLHKEEIEIVTLENAKALDEYVILPGRGEQRPRRRTAPVQAGLQQPAGSGAAGGSLLAVKIQGVCKARSHLRRCPRAATDACKMSLHGI